MERLTLSFTDVDVIRGVCLYAQESSQSVYITSGTGHVSEAIIRPFHSQQLWRYQGYGRIDTIIGYRQPYYRSGSIHVELAGLDPPMGYATAFRLIAHGTVRLEVSVIARPPMVAGRRRIQANR